jgi:hypothetical protein
MTKQDEEGPYALKEYNTDISEFIRISNPFLRKRRKP